MPRNGIITVLCYSRVDSVVAGVTVIIEVKGMNEFVRCTGDLLKNSKLRVDAVERGSKTRAVKIRDH